MTGFATGGPVDPGALPKLEHPAPYVFSAERWLPVPGYEGSYEVSDLGRVRSLDRISAQGRAIRGTVLSAVVGSSGYQQVNLHCNRKQTTHLVHRLVALAFFGSPVGDMEVRHLNGDPTNNYVSNLAYGTSSQNTLDAVAHGTHINVRKTYCPQGHAYEGENLRVDKNGHRRCDTCRRESFRRVNARRSAARKVA